MIRRALLKVIGATAILSLGALASPALAQDKTIRVASVTGPSHHHNISLRWFAEQVAARDAGLNIEVLDGAQLGGERDYIEGMMLGSIQMAQVSTAPIAGFVPEFDLFSLPYLIRDTEHFKAVISGPVGAKFNEMAEARGIKILAWFDNGYRNVFNKVRPVVTPEDMGGLKIRVMESPLMVNTVNAMGGSATPMSYSELYTALEQGVLDGGENATGNVLNDRFYEVTSYLSMTQHFRPPGVVAISLGTWNGLTAEQQQVLVEESARLQDYEIALTAEVGAQALEELQAKGMQVNEVDVEAFRARMGPIYEDFKSKHGGELLEAVQNTTP
ncbi:tripartite ATP-independent transporter solute receptor, DctP family [Roseovarius azorensis]|uniref:Tripartite ATP-independent transporter solute receptor, DctP family n=1 Tax=Roseovarius azorensis TaxID=1287727 RepID=A0A1H7P3U5_9RHOB|nr:TRAP transporter substrate-binding protein [Roseovarius azorensis]SEL29757.1 tripartite ATP-independent transporter solute receptor, DctP family [Roseovarius azorensis]